MINGSCTVGGLVDKGADLGAVEYSVGKYCLASGLHSGEM